MGEAGVLARVLGRAEDEASGVAESKMREAGVCACTGIGPRKTATKLRGYDVSDKKIAGLGESVLLAEKKSLRSLEDGGPQARSGRYTSRTTRKGTAHAKSRRVTTQL
jgi:hypothetical protein